MDNRNRWGGQQDRGERSGWRSRQTEQFSSESDWQQGDDSWRAQEGRQGWESDWTRDRTYSRDENGLRDDFGRPGSGYRADTSALDDYDRPWGGARYEPQERSYGRSGLGYGGYSQSRNMPGYGADRYGSRGFGSGSYRSRESGRYGSIPPRRYDPEERGFFERASDEVMSWFGDDDAARRREMDHRVNHRGKGPAGYTRSAERILEDANERLMHDPHIDATGITVRCDDGEITLDGTVESRFAKRHAEEIVEDIAGVKHVQNNLRVQSRENYYSQTGTASES